MAVDFAQGTGLEAIQTQAFLAILNGLNDEIENQETIGQTLDATLAIQRGVPYEEIWLERIENENFHWGHRPSLIEAPIDEYPNVSVMAYLSTPQAGQSDQVDSSDTTVAIELMVKSPYADKTDRERLHRAEEVVNKRIQRLTNAVVVVLGNDKTLGGTVLEVKMPPAVIITNAFPRRENTASGEVWLWQMSRLEFAVEKYADYNS